MAPCVRLEQTSTTRYTRYWSKEVSMSKIHDDITDLAIPDEQAIRSVLNKFVDAAGVSQYAYLLLRPEDRDKIKVLERSIDSPSHLLMARKGLDAKLVSRIRQTLLALDKSKALDKSVLARLYGVEGYAPAKLSDFAEVANVASRYGFIKKPQLFAAPKTRKPKP